jgi:outer membrane protein TolC
MRNATENELLDARLARIQSEQQLSSDRVQLFRALGGGWGRDVLTTAN